MNKRPKVTWRSIVFADIEGLHIIPLVILLILIMFCVALGVDKILTTLHYTGETNVTHHH
jgi:hypothetical protein